MVCWYYALLFELSVLALCGIHAREYVRRSGRKVSSLTMGILYFVLFLPFAFYLYFAYGPFGNSFDLLP